MASVGTKACFSRGCSTLALSLCSSAKPSGRRVSAWPPGVGGCGPKFRWHEATVLPGASVTEEGHSPKENGGLLPRETGTGRASIQGATCVTGGHPISSEASSLRAGRSGPPFPRQTFSNGSRAGAPESQATCPVSPKRHSEVPAHGA